MSDRHHLPIDLKTTFAIVTRAQGEVVVGPYFHEELAGRRLIAAGGPTELIVKCFDLHDLIMSDATFAHHPKAGSSGRLQSLHLTRVWKVDPPDEWRGVLAHEAFDRWIRQHEVVRQSRYRPNHYKDPRVRTNNIGEMVSRDRFVVGYTNPTFV